MDSDDVRARGFLLRSLRHGVGDAVRDANLMSEAADVIEAQATEIEVLRLMLEPFGCLRGYATQDASVIRQQDLQEGEIEFAGYIITDSPIRALGPQEQDT